MMEKPTLTLSIGFAMVSPCLEKLFFIKFSKSSNTGNHKEERKREREETQRSLAACKYLSRMEPMTFA